MSYFISINALEYIFKCKIFSIICDFFSGSVHIRFVPHSYNIICRTKNTSMFLFFFLLIFFFFFFCFFPDLNLSIDCLDNKFIWYLIHDSYQFVVIDFFPPFSSMVVNHARVCVLFSSWLNCRISFITQFFYFLFFCLVIPQ